MSFSSESLIVTLLDWCLNNGIHIDPNIRILHHEKDGICVRSASRPIASEQSRKRFSLTLAVVSQQCAIFAITTMRLYLSVDVSCRNPEVRRAFYPFVLIGRPYSSRAVRA